MARLLVVGQPGAAVLDVCRHVVGPDYDTNVAQILPQVLAFIGAFLLGGISPGYLIVKRWRGVDVRATGSGKTGATNVGRILGNKAAAAVLVLDAMKAMLPVAAMQLAAPQLTGIVAIGIVAGHVWPPFLGFRGGRGVAPAVGALILLSPAMLGGLLAVFLVGHAVLRDRHLAAMASFATLGIASALLLHAHPHAIPIAVVAFVVAVAHIRFRGRLDDSPRTAHVQDSDRTIGV